MSVAGPENSFDGASPGAAGPSRETEPDSVIATQKIPPSRRKRVIRLVLCFVIPYLAVVFMLTVFQRRLIYFPFREAVIRAYDTRLPGGRVHDIAVFGQDGLELKGWHVLPEGHTCPPEECDAQLQRGRPVVLYFSGNAANRSYRVSEVEVLCRLGADVFIVDYRGYGDNQGSPSEEMLAADAEALWKYATRDRKIEPKRIVLYGESLGGGVATRLAEHACRNGTPPGGLILRSTFSSLADAGACHYPWLPVRMCLVDRYDSATRIGSVTCPILQVHGDRDHIVPIEIGRRLFDRAPPQSESGIAKRFAELPNAGHNDVLLTAERALSGAVREFFEAIQAESVANAAL